MRELRAFVKAAKEQGWSLKRTKCGWMMFPPTKELPPVTIHITGSKRSNKVLTRSQLRRSGLKV